MSDRASTASAAIRTTEEFSVASGIDARPSRVFLATRRAFAGYSQRIEAAMDRLGYRPNLFAVNFNRRKPKTVGIMFPPCSTRFYGPRAAD